jgi:uncharacterized protein with FMN-binding domain
MKLNAHRFVPALIMTAAASVPVITTAEILTRAADGRSESTLAALPPATPTPAPRATAQPTKTAASPRPTVTAQPTKAAAAPVSRIYAGTVVYDQYGAVQAQITVKGKTITNVAISAPTDGRSGDINSQAVPLLVSETLRAQSATIDLVSGATETSDAYLQSLQSVLSTAGLS